MRRWRRPRGPSLAHRVRVEAHAVWLAVRDPRTPWAARIVGVLNFGFFATVEGIGGDGLMPARDLGREYFRYDEAAQQLVGEETGTSYASGQRLPLRLAEANPVSGALRFELVEQPDDERPERSRPKRVIKRRGRPGNIRHQGRKR
jgi:ribonuclease R